MQRVRARPGTAARASRRAGSTRWWLAPCAAVVIAGQCAADVIERDVTPQIEGAQAQQRLELELRQAQRRLDFERGQAQRPLAPGRTSSPQSLRLEQRDTVERLRQQSLQSQQRNELGMQRGQLRGGEGYALQQRFEEQHRQQMLRNRDRR